MGQSKRKIEFFRAGRVCATRTTTRQSFVNYISSKDERQFQPESPELSDER